MSRLRGGRWLAAAVIACVLVFDARTLRAYYAHGRPEWDRIASFLAGRVQPGERVVVSNSWVLRNLGYYWSDRGLGREDTPLERGSGEIEGPAWIVIAICPMSAETRREVDALPVRLLSPNTNGCEVRFLPAGARLRTVGGFCLRDA